jgi:DNA-binding transcriptional MerR regulator
MHEINDVIKYTGLKDKFIRKCLTMFKDILEPYVHRGTFNKILIDDSGLVLFDRIRQLKEEGLSIPQIQKRLSKSLEGGQSRKTEVSKVRETGRGTGKTIKQITETETYQTFFADLQNKIEQLHTEVKEEKDKRLQDIQLKHETIRELERGLATASTALKLLPEGKSPEQIRADYDNERRRKEKLHKLTEDIKNINTLRWRKKRRARAHSPVPDF